MSQVTQNQDEIQPKQRFTGYWIPVELSKMDLTKTEQFLLSMIDSLEDEAPEYCFASNAYLAEKMELSESRISFYITKFKRLGLIEEVGFDGRRRRMRTIKSKWYERIDKNSKKDLCVTSRSQGARTHEPSMRDFTNHITKKIKKSIISDDDRVRGADEKKKDDPPEKAMLRTFDTKGNEHHHSISEIFRYFVGKPYSIDIIKQAIKRTETNQGSINNVLKYIESTCRSIESQNASKSVLEKPKSAHKKSLPKNPEQPIVEDRKEPWTPRKPKNNINWNIGIFNPHNT